MLPTSPVLTELVERASREDSAEALWQRVASPPWRNGGSFYARITPALPPADALSVPFDIQRIARSLHPERSESALVLPLQRGVYLVSFGGVFTVAALKLLKVRLHTALEEWARRQGSDFTCHITEPYLWWNAGDGLHGEGEAPPTELLLHLFSRDSVPVVFQPIVSLRDGATLGCEALARGDAGTALEMPIALFACAAQVNLSHELDALCQRSALEASYRLGKANPRIFLNVDPSSLHRQSFDESVLARTVERLGISPSQVVIEITERQAIADFGEFARALRAYREVGFRVAVDDAGAGYSSLQAIAEVSPDYVKIDRSLVDGIDTNPNKRTLLTFLTQFASQIGTHLIAEGIETLSQLTTLGELGVDYGQGFYLAYPEVDPPALHDGVRERIVATNQRRLRGQTGQSHTVGVLQNSGARTLGPLDRIKAVQELFEAIPENDGMAVVDETGRPVGLMMKRDLQARLAMPYGRELLERKMVQAVMEKAPLLINEDDSVEQAARRLLSSEQGKLDDHIIVTSQGRYSGVIPARHLLERITSLQVNQAKYANPLTGLPGNVPTEDEVNRRLRADENIAVLYIDLDNFKPFNDHYGVAHGDRVLEAVAALLQQILNEHSNGTEYIGHLGGDDFLLVTAPDLAQIIAAGITSEFDLLAPSFYSPEDRDRGCLFGLDRRGIPTRFPLLSVSVAGIANNYIPLYGYLQATEMIGALKTRLKQCSGSQYLIAGLEEDYIASCCHPTLPHALVK
jgi:EAL domain-containing protein (putative c-di-GMP-specific phosphodiesterase class I)/GGDEF domain-containing protein